MSDTQPPTSTEPTSTKRDRLVAAACEVIYRQGVAGTTLADISDAASVPLGNLYYYFKTKEDLVAAVVDLHAQQLSAGLVALENAHPSAPARLQGLVDVLAERSELIARYGCPFGSLAAELSKRHDGDDRLTAALILIPMDWAEQQFRQMGRPDAADLAAELIGAYQGAAVLASTLSRPELMAGATRRLKQWLEGVNQ